MIRRPGRIRDLFLSKGSTPPKGLTTKEVNTHEKLF